jgi:2Fe-2S ferredoxin
MVKVPKIIFISSDGGSRQECDAQTGQSVLDVAHEGDVDIEGACEGSMACSTCHVVVSPDWFAKLPAASEFEEDMLDLTYGLKMTSRLGCQLVVTEELDGMELTLPTQTMNMSG